AVLLRVAVRLDDGRGTGPEVVVDRRRDGRGPLRLADAIATLVAKTARGGDLAQVAGADPGDGLLQALARADLRAGLHDAVVFLCGGDELAAFPDVVRE